jgi:hypothetical protein
VGKAFFVGGFAAEELAPWREKARDFRKGSFAVGKIMRDGRELSRGRDNNPPSAAIPHRAVRLTTLRYSKLTLGFFNAQYPAVSSLRRGAARRGARGKPAIALLAHLTQFPRIVWNFDSAARC